MTDASQEAPVAAESEPADIEAQESPVETAEAPATEESSEGSETTAEAESEPSSDETAEKERKKNSFQERISELTQRAKEAEAQVKEHQEREAMLRQQFEGQEDTLKRPQLQDFDYDQEAYEAALLDYTSQITQRGFQQARAKEEQLIAQQRMQAANMAAREAFQARSEAFKEEHPDFEAVINSSPVMAQAGEAIQQGVLLSDNGPALAYHLAKNPDLTAQINSLPPGMAMMQLGVLSQKLAAPAPVVTSKTPAPATPVSPSGKVEKDPNEMTPDEYAKWRGYR